MPLSDLLYVRAGRFDRPIAVEQQSQILDDFGQPVIIWTEMFRCKAEILPFIGQISGFTLKPAPDFAVAPVTINIRYSGSRAAAMAGQKLRARHLTTGDIFRVLYVGNPENAQKILQFACQVAT